MPPNDDDQEVDEPKVKWKKSKAKELLYKDLVDGRVPLNAKDSKGKSTMKLRDIYMLRPELQEYKYSKFSSRLSSLRKTVGENISRQRTDQKAFDNYLANHKHEVSLFTAKGYIQWQGSEAQRLVQESLEDNENEALEWQEWHSSEPAFYEHFPIDVFRDKVNQEIRTNKYLHTLEMRGKDTRKTKKKNRMKPHEHRPPPKD